MSSESEFDLNDNAEYRDKYLFSMDVNQNQYRDLRVLTIAEEVVVLDEYDLCCLFGRWQTVKNVLRGE